MLREVLTKSWPTSIIRQGLREEETLGLAREMEECCEQREWPECWLWGRKIFSEQKASQSDWDTGNKEGWCQVEAAFYKVFGFRTLLQSNWKSLKNLQEVNQRFRFVFQSSLCCVWRLLLLNHSVVSDLCDLMVSHHAPLVHGIFRQEYWSGWPFPTPKRCLLTHSGMIFMSSFIHVYFSIFGTLKRNQLHFSNLSAFSVF